MTRHPTAERDDAIAALLASSAGDPDLWTIDALRREAGADADLLFPEGVPEMVEAWCDLADRAMLADAKAAGTATRPRVGERVREAMLLRLPADGLHRDASRRALAVLARPGEARRAARVLARTADAIWQAAGDTSTGLSRHTRRLTVGGIWSATLLYAIGRGNDADAVAAFLDRRLAASVRLGRFRRRLERFRRRLGGATASPAPPPTLK